MLHLDLGVDACALESRLFAIETIHGGKQFAIGIMDRHSLNERREPGL